LLNIRKHANAQNVRISMSNEEKNFCLVISDDGQGFNINKIKAHPIDKGGAGLTNLQVRAQTIGGTLTIRRDVTGQGTEVRLTLPKLDK
jgi:signal transduction histidine kinase